MPNGSLRRAWRHDVHTNVARCKIGGDRTRHRDNAALRSRIGGQTGLAQIVVYRSFKMMLPFSFNKGAAEFTVKKAALRLVRMTFSKIASSVEPVGVRAEMPALAKTMSSLPKSLARSAKSRFRSSATVTSAR